jgi:hypothetical protein
MHSADSREHLCCPLGIILAASPEDIPEVSLSIAIFTQQKLSSYPSHQTIGSDLRLLEVIIHKHS